MTREQIEHGKASIVLLIGTSSAGKGTIIKELKRQDELKELSKKANWQEDGTDIEARRYGNLFQKHLDIINGDAGSVAIFDQLKESPAIGAGRILESIFFGKFRVGETEISLTEKEIDIAEIEKFTNQLSESERQNFTQKSIEDLHALTQKHQVAFLEAAKNIPSFSQQMENIFARAIENSKKGLATILDFIPDSSYDLVGEFNKYCQSQNFSCPSIIALAHCDISAMVEHMDKRNAGGNSEEKRDGFFPMDQYASTYHVTDDDNPRAVASLTMQDILNAANKYGANRGNVLLLENSKDAQGFVKNIGMAQDFPLDKPVKVATSIPYDVLYQTDPKNKPDLETGIKPDATLKIAKHLNDLVVTDSSIPKGPSPTAKLMQKSWVEKMEAKKAESENSKDAGSRN